MNVRLECTFCSRIISFHHPGSSPNSVLRILILGNCQRYEESISLKQNTFQEAERESLNIDNTEIELDTWPRIHVSELLTQIA